MLAYAAVVPVIQLTTRQLAEFAQSPQSIPEDAPAERDCANSLHYAGTQYANIVRAVVILIH